MDVTVCRELRRCAAVVFGSKANDYDEFLAVAHNFFPHLPLIAKSAIAAAADLYAPSLTKAISSRANTPSSSSFCGPAPTFNIHQRTKEAEINVLSSISPVKASSPRREVASLFQPLIPEPLLHTIVPGESLNMSFGTEQPALCELVSPNTSMITDYVHDIKGGQSFTGAIGQLEDNAVPSEATLTTKLNLTHSSPLIVGDVEPDSVGTTPARSNFTKNSDIHVNADWDISNLEHVGDRTLGVPELPENHSDNNHSNAVGVSISDVNGKRSMPLEVSNPISTPFENMSVLLERIKAPVTSISSLGERQESPIIPPNLAARTTTRFTKTVNSKVAKLKREKKHGSHEHKIQKRKLHDLGCDQPKRKHVTEDHETRKWENRLAMARAEEAKALALVASSNLKTLTPAPPSPALHEELPTLDQRIEQLLNSDQPVYIPGFPITTVTHVCSIAGSTPRDQTDSTWRQSSPLTVTSITASIKTPVPSLLDITVLPPQFPIPRHPFIPSSYRYRGAVRRNRSTLRAPRQQTFSVNPLASATSAPVLDSNVIRALTVLGQLFQGGAPLEAAISTTSLARMIEAQTVQVTSTTTTIISRG